MAQVRVLLVEDSPSDAALFKAQLEAGPDADFDVEWVPTYAEGRDRIADADCTILDLTLPDSEGLSSVRGLAEAAPDMPVIVLTGFQEESGGVEAVRLGAQDYLVKDNIQPQDLGRAVRHAIERKTAQAELRALTAELAERNQRLASSNSAIFDQSLTGMMQIAGDAQVLLANRAMGNLVGRTADELRGRRVDDLFGAIDGPDVVAAIAEVFETGLPWGRDALLMRADGSTRLTTLQVSQLTMDEAGTPIVLMMANDITAESSAMLREAHDQKLAELGRLAGGLAHEIRSPLQYLTTSMDWIRTAVGRLVEGERLPDEDLADLGESMEEVVDGISRISDIVRGMNTLAHRASSDMRLQNIDDVLDFPLAVARGQAPAGVRFEVRRDDTPRCLFGLGLIQQVVLNLLVNAVQAIEDAERPGVVEITTAALDEWVTLTVSDNGVGMDAATLDRAMEPFFTTKPAGRGTGQGLSLVREIMTQHEGRVTMDSTPGRGTAVTIWLPAGPHEDFDSSSSDPGR
ncbi:MAG: ATP-binding protein [Actinomycetota bacterium]